MENCHPGNQLPMIYILYLRENPAELGPGMTDRLDMLLRDWMRRLKRFLFYHPERHYLRGRPSRPE
jgi:hypothetical protein